MSRTVSEMIRLAKMFDHMTNGEVAEILSNEGCSKCFIQDKCKNTAGVYCEDLIEEYLAGEDW